MTQTQIRRDANRGKKPSNSTLTEEEKLLNEKKKKKQATQQKKPPEEVATNDLIKRNLLNKIKFFKEDAKEFKTLQEKVQHFQEKKSAGTFYIEHNKKITGNYISYKKE